MAQDLPLESVRSISAHLARAIGQACAEAQWNRWGLSQKCFADALCRSAEKNFRGRRPTGEQLEAYLKSLHLQDFALACACAEGSETAWEFFVANFRQVLRASAGAILRGSGSGAARADELADSLYAELYGVTSTGSRKRKSLFDYFHGRSKLSTWLRSVLAQRHVDLLRAGHRTVSLESESAEAPGREILSSDFPAPADPHRDTYVKLFERALLAALAGLDARKRMLLAQYYVDRLTLAEIGRIRREHESTISRQLDRINTELRERVTQLLRDGAPPPGLNEAQIALAFEYALGDWPFDLNRALAQETSGSLPKDREKD